MAARPRTTGINGGGNNGHGAPLVPQKHGSALRAGGTPGHRPGPGRPTNEARELVSEMLRSSKAWCALRTILRDADHKHFPVVYQQPDDATMRGALETHRPIAAAPTQR